MHRTIENQVVVITGASSGIGREAAFRFGQKGAAVVLVARSEADMQQMAARIVEAGGRAHVVVADVSDWRQMQIAAQQAVDRFGRIDTWVNAAAVAEYATVEQTTPDEMEQILRVNLLGQFNGIKAALQHMKPQNHGTIINIGSVESRRGLPYHGAYAASKHGIKGLTDAFRLELAYEKTQIQVTLILPASINTPLFNHARSKLGVMPKPIPPVYEPGLVADAILLAAQRPRREIVVGGAGRVMTLMESISPALGDRFLLMGGQGFRKQLSNRPDNEQDNLFAPMDGSGRRLGDYSEQSVPGPYTRLFEFYPNRKRALLATALLGAVGLAAFGITRRS